jgi:hypothetical protein
MISVDEIYSNVVLVTFITLSIYIVFAIQHKSNTLTDDDVNNTCDCIIAKISRLSSKNKYTKYVQKKSNKDMRRIERMLISNKKFADKRSREDFIEFIIANLYDTMKKSQTTDATLILNMLRNDWQRTHTRSDPTFIK